MSVAEINYDIPGSYMQVGIASQFSDYAIRRHLVKTVQTAADAQDKFHTDYPTWAVHHVIPNLPCQSERIINFGRDSWIIEQVFGRKRTSPWADSNGKRQELRLSMDACPVFIKSDATKTNGLPYDAAPTPPDFYLLPLDSTSNMSASLAPVSYQYMRPLMRITDQRTYSSYPLTAGQLGCLGKVNAASVTLNSVGLTFAASEVRFVGADFVMESDGTGTTGRWAGAYYFDAIVGGHYMQRAYWDTGTSAWKVANSLQYETADIAGNF